jgi:hypothetical protein
MVVAGAGPVYLWKGRYHCDELRQRVSHFLLKGVGVAETINLDKGQEYATLRAELLEAKRYVFERPLAIAAAAVAAVGLKDKSEALIAALPLAVSLLTLFNFSFTLNRLQSASRISAYIQLVLEPSAAYPWIGWETSLRLYRKWLKKLIRKGRREAAKFVEQNVERDAVPDALMYYPMIYSFHLALAGGSIITSIFQLTHPVGVLVVIGNCAAIGVGLILIAQFWERRPERVRSSIEKNIVIWKFAFSEWELMLKTHQIQDAHDDGTFVRNRVSDGEISEP